MSNKIQIPVDRLQIGMSVLELDRPWIDTPFLLQGFTISTKSDISALQQYCNTVYVDADSMPVKQRKNKKDDAINKPGLFNNLYRRPAEVVTTPVEKEISQARTIHKKTSSLVRSCMDDILLGNALNETALKENVAETVESIVRNPDAMMWLTRLKDKDTTTSQHSINSSILSVTFGRYIGLPKDELIKLAICGLMHDIGKLQVPTEILNKPSSLSESERQQIQMHPLYSRNLLMSAGQYFLPAVDVAYSHHERLDGSGYPRKLKAMQISPFTRIISIIDTYDTMITRQVYREERTPFETLKYLNSKKSTSFDEQLIKLFIKLIGVFPIGSVIELTSGEVGIVITSNRDDNLRPKILIMLDSNKRVKQRSIINLARTNVDQLGRPLKIAKTLRKGDYGIDQEQLIAEGVEFTVIN